LGAVAVGLFAATATQAQTLADCDAAITGLRAGMTATRNEVGRAGAQGHLRAAEREHEDQNVAACLAEVTAGTAALGAGEFQPTVTGVLHLDLQNDYTYRRRGGRATNDLRSDSEFEMAVNLTPFFSIVSLLHSEPVREPPDGDRFLTDNALWLEELYGRFDWQRGGIRVGKFNPAFGKAWDEHVAPGIYGRFFAEDSYKLTEGMGFNPYLRFDGGPAGKVTAGASVFKFDNTWLSNSAFVSPRFDEDRTERVGRNRVRFGGPGNTAWPTSLAATVEGENLLGVAGLGWNIGAERLARGRAAGDTSQYGAVAGLTYDGPIAPLWDLRAVAEVAYLRRFEGARHDNLVATVGAEATYDKTWRFFAHYAQARRQSERTLTNPIQVEDEDGNLVDDVEQFDLRETAIDRIYSVGVGYSFDFGLNLDLAWVRRTGDREALVRDTARDGIGFRAHYAFTF
jgi:hypothetical protein